MSTPDRPVIIERLKKSVLRLKGRQFNLDELTEDATLFEDLSLDSLDLLEMRFDIEEAWDIKLEDQEAESLRTVRNVVDLIEDKVKLAT
jgi:acyl carrier protein